MLFRSLVTGYDANNVYLYDPTGSVEEKMGQNDAAEMFEHAGNIFFGYIVEQ